MKRYIDWAEYGQLVDTLIETLQGSNTTHQGILGVSRGGLPISTSLSHALDLPISLIIRAASYDKENQQGRLKIFTQFPDGFDFEAKYLIVDDICDTGQTFDELIKLLPNSDTCALIRKKGSQHDPNYWIEEGDKWVVFPWERQD